MAKDTKAVKRSTYYSHYSRKHSVQGQTSRSNKLFLWQGFDFAFIRRSRLYDECGEQTKYKWDSQYIGGNTLALCNGKVPSSAAHVLDSRKRNQTGFVFLFTFAESPLQISGAKMAYFPKNQNCLTTKSSSQHRSDIITTFINELKDQSVHGDPQHACLICGEQ